MKEKLLRTLLSTIQSAGISSVTLGAPKSYIATKEWVGNNRQIGASVIDIHPTSEVHEQAPLTTEETIHEVYTNEYERKRPAAFVASIPRGRVWGRNGAVITPDDVLLGDVSREFGRYKGRYNHEHSIFRRIQLGSLKKIHGTVAVVATSGSSNFYHWMYDVMPRFALLQQSGLWHTIDHFIIDYTGLAFQKECLSFLGVDDSKIIPSNNQWKFHLQASILLVPSLPSVLSCIEQWSVDYLRILFDIKNTAQPAHRKLYISRRKAPSRNLINEHEIFKILQAAGYQEFFAEEHTIAEAAALFNQASHVAGVHGAGFSNIVFCQPGVKVIDMVAPLHVDGIFWMLTNKVSGQYAYVFAEGERPAAGTDLVQHKHDENLYVDPHKFLETLKLVN